MAFKAQDSSRAFLTPFYYDYYYLLFMIFTVRKVLALFHPKTLQHFKASFYIPKFYFYQHNLLWHFPHPPGTTFSPFSSSESSFT